MKPRGKAAVYVLLILLRGFCTSTLAAQVPHVAFIPVRNNTGNSGYDALVTALSQNLELNLSLIDSHYVFTVDDIDPLSDLRKAELFFQENNIDNAVYGEVSLDRREQINISIYVYEKVKRTIVFSPSVTLGSIFEIYDESDRLAAELIENFTNIRFAFGTIVMRNTGGQGDYYLYIDEKLAGKNVSRVSVLTGTREIKVTEKPGWDSTALGRKTIVVGEGGEYEVIFSVPEQAGMNESGSAGLELSEQENRSKQGFAMVNLFTGPNYRGSPFVFTEYFQGNIPLEHKEIASGIPVTFLIDRDRFRYTFADRRMYDIMVLSPKLPLHSSAVGIAGYLPLLPIPDLLPEFSSRTGRKLEVKWPSFLIPIGIMTVLGFVFDNLQEFEKGPIYTGVFGGAGLLLGSLLGLKLKPVPKQVENKTNIRKNEDSLAEWKKQNSEREAENQRLLEEANRKIEHDNMRRGGVEVTDLIEGSKEFVPF